jgi:hypothetical protein
MVRDGVAFTAVRVAALRAGEVAGGEAQLLPKEEAVER